MVKPIEIARKLGVSTSALRHYESWGIVPKANRNANGYRVYTTEHVAYFECIRAMQSGFGMGLVRKIMPLLQENKVSEALWMVNEVQVELLKDKKKAEQALTILEQDSLHTLINPKKNKQWYTIGEAAEAIDVPSSTIRHWELEGLIVSERNMENGYRKFSRSDLRKLLVIRTLQKAVFSLEVVREVLAKMDQHNLEEAIKITRESLVYLDYLVKEQLRGISYLYKLCKVLEERK